MSFEDDLKKFTLKVKVRQHEELQKLALDLTRRIVQKSPVDTGRFTRIPPIKV